MYANERRQHPRFPFHSKAEIRMTATTYRGNLIDISLFGALFEARLFHFDFAPREGCTLEILQLNDDALFRIKGVIAHNRMNLIGIQFAPIDSERQTILRHISMLNLAPPSLLNRKLPALFQAWQS